VRGCAERIQLDHLAAWPTPNETVVTRNTVEIKAQAILGIDYSKAAVPDRSDGVAADDENPPF
jgi:hypothetical protein